MKFNDCNGGIVTRNPDWYTVSTGMKKNDRPDTADSRSLNDPELQDVELIEFGECFPEAFHDLFAVAGKFKRWTFVIFATQRDGVGMFLAAINT